MTRRICVLGAGFIGRRLAKRFSNAGSEVLLATRRPISDIPPFCKNVVAAFDRPEHFAYIAEQCDAIIHSATTSTPSSTVNRPLQELEKNLRPTIALLEALQTSVETRLIFLSSGGTVYGECDAVPLSESQPLQPRSYHGAAKAASEQFIRAWCEQSGGDAIVLRPSNVYGPGQAAREGFGIIPAAFDHAMRGIPLTVWDQGRSVRDFLYIDDLVSLIVKAIETGRHHGMRVFNAASDQAISINSLLDRIDRCTGLPLVRKNAVSRTSDLRIATPCADQARRYFDWEPRVSLDSGLEATWNWIKPATIGT